MKNKFKIFRDSSANNPNKAPVSGITLTVGYIVACVFIVIGVPAPHTGSSSPIPYENLPLAITIFVGLYFVILELLMIMGKVRKNYRGSTINRKYK